LEYFQSIDLSEESYLWRKKEIEKNRIEIELNYSPLKDVKPSSVGIVPENELLNIPLFETLMNKEIEIECNVMSLNYSEFKDVRFPSSIGMVPEKELPQIALFEFETLIE